MAGTSAPVSWLSKLKSPATGTTNGTGSDEMPLAMTVSEYVPAGRNEGSVKSVVTSVLPVCHAGAAPVEVRAK